MVLLILNPSPFLDFPQFASLTHFSLQPRYFVLNKKLHNKKTFKLFDGGYEKVSGDTKRSSTQNKKEKLILIYYDCEMCGKMELKWNDEESQFLEKRYILGWKDL